MTVKHTIEIETLTLLVIAVALGGFVVWRNNQNFQNRFYALAPINLNNQTQADVTPVTNPVLETDTAAQISPDGEKKLVMLTTHNADGTRKYEFNAINTSDNTQTPIYTTVASGSGTFAIPFNAWSPDDRFLFIQKDKNDALVFRTSGEMMTNDSQYLDVGDVFAVRNIPNTPQETTGWASPTLLIVNTTTPDNTKGPSYWFEVPSTAIIPLASQF